MSYQTIRSAQQAIWPAVKDSIARHRASRAAVEADPDGATTAALTRARKPWNRVVAEETVWAIAKANLLATPEQAAVVEAAQTWVRTTAPDFVDEMDDEERALYAAVQTLAATLPENLDETDLSA